MVAGAQPLRALVLDPVCGIRRVLEDPRQLMEPLVIELQRVAADVRVVTCEATARGGLGDHTPDLVEGRPEQALPDSVGKLRPRPVGDAQAPHGPVVMLDRAPPGLGAGQLDEPDPFEVADVVADRSQGRIRGGRDLARTGHALLENAEDVNA